MAVTKAKTWVLGRVLYGEQLLGDFKKSSLISGAEVVEVVKQLLGGRAPGLNKICPELVSGSRVVEREVLASLLRLLL